MAAALVRAPNQSIPLLSSANGKEQKKCQVIVQAPQVRALVLQTPRKTELSNMQAGNASPQAGIQTTVSVKGEYCPVATVKMSPAGLPPEADVCESKRKREIRRRLGSFTCIHYLRGMHPSPAGEERRYWQNGKPRGCEEVSSLLQLMVHTCPSSPFLSK